MTETTQVRAPDGPTPPALVGRPVLLLPPDNGGLMLPPLASGTLELPLPLDDERLPQKLAVALSRKGHQLRREVWNLAGLHTLDFTVAGNEDDLLLTVRLPAYDFIGQEIV